MFFTKAFCGFCLLSLTLATILTIIQPFVSVSLWLNEYSWDGLMANRNAFMLLVVCTIGLVEVYRFSGHALFSNKIHNLMWTLIPTFMLYNGSRTGWAITGLFLAALLFKKPLLVAKKILPFFFSRHGIFIFPSFHCHPQHNEKTKTSNYALNRRCERSNNLRR